MRRVLGAMAVGVLVLTGCVGITDPATNVTQTSARLNAHGRTDDTPAHFYFRYANQEADLPTAAAKRTPTRTIPANRPDNGGYGYFGENVTGLSPGRLYFFELCGADDKPGAVERCGGVQRFVTKPSLSQDSVQGSIYAGAPYGSRVIFEAASGPQGQNADGWVTVRYRDWYVLAEGRVTCQAVNGNRAVVGVVGRYSGGESFSAIFTVTDGPATIGIVTQSPPNCGGGSFDNQDAANDDQLTIHDAN